MDKEFMAKMEKLKEEMPEVLGNFMQVKNVAFKDDALTEKTKTLMAVAVAVSLRCEDCIKNHVYSALDLGASKKEILEASTVAIVMGGGPSISYTTKVMEIIDNYEKEAK